MRILVLGGAGDMGSQAVEDLATTEGVAKVTIGDLNAAAAEVVRDRCRGSTAEVVVRTIDATDASSLVAEMRRHDIVASALGPFHRFEPKLVRAALDAGVNYASICDEWQAAEAVIDEFDAEARERGRIIVTGLGVSPGISNVTVRFLADGMDQLKRADIYTYQPLDAGGGEAVLQHLLYIMSGKVVAHRNGRRTLVAACSESREEEFPVFGKIRMWNMGHSEPATIPRFIPGVREVNFYLGFGRGSELFVRPAQLGLFTTRRRVDVAARFLHKITEFTKSDQPGTGAIRIDAWGEKDGAVVHRMACGVGGMRHATGLSLSIGTLMMLRGHLRTERGGVYAPEAIIAPQPFVDAFRAKGLELYEDLQLTTPSVVTADGGDRAAPRERTPRPETGEGRPLS